MPQKTNLNINPYYDDFDKDKDFYRVLFKPGYPIQARELTTLQSILQNQIESFGSHVFKEGSMVIPGGITFDDNYNSVKLNIDHLGIDINIYANNLVGKKLRGQTSGVVAVVDKWLDVSESEGITNPTLFVRYLDADDTGEVVPFSDGEVLITEEGFTYGNTTVNAEETVASLIDENATAVGTAVGIADGVYFIRGTFVDVSKHKIVLDPYSANSSYRVGLTILEEIVTAKDDNSLYDNARGYSNYAAPGADRLKISLSLSKKLLTDFDDKSFVELVRIDEGKIKKLQDKSSYNLIRDYFAKRTFEESGDYAVDRFNVEVNESLNNGLSNGGVYSANQSTDQGNTPSEDLVTVKVSPGRAYVKGYDIDSVSTTNIDVQKPRDRKSVSSALIPFEFGTVIKVNNVQGTPVFGVNNNSNIVRLQNQRRNSSSTSATGTEIGKARVYSFSLSNASYSNASSEWDLYLFDIQTYTKITLNETVTNTQVPTSSYIRGVSSGASGYVETAPGGGSILNLIQTSGTFIEGEQILINETTEVSRSIKVVQIFGIEDIKSIYQDSDSIDANMSLDFIADSALQKKTAKNFGIADIIRITSAGNVTSPGKNFVGIKSDTIIRYQRPGFSDETFNRVVSVNSDNSMTVAAVENISGVCTGGLPTVDIDTTFTISAPSAKDAGGLFAPIQSENVASVSLSGSNLLVSSQIKQQTTSPTGSLSINVSSTGITSAFFETFDPERYSIFYSDGTIEDLSSDQVSLGSNGQTITFTGLTPSQSSNVTVNTTVKKNSITNKTKNFTRSTKVNIDKTVSGVSTAISGLTEGSFYGTRVQDREICLNFPDVVEVLAVYESLDTSTPTLDSIEFPSGLSLNTSSILGERVVGSTSGAIAQVVTRSSATKVEIVYLNTNKFVVGEVATFSESNIISNVQTVNNGNYQEVTSKYILDKGVRDQFYDYARIVRSTNYIPSHKLMVIFNHYTIPSNDAGNLYTVNSYTEERYKSDIPLMSDGRRATDTLDFRPRVAQFTSTTLSPFDFASRTFATAGINPTLVVAPNESSLIGYDFYLPRVDKVVLNKEGAFSVIQGVSAENPKAPANSDDAMEIAIISLPAYLYDPSNVAITAVDNRRYTMRDIGKIEDRVENLENVTSLSLLELNTQTLQVRDFDGLDRFKSGFFVDDFRDNQRMDRLQTSASIDTATNELITPIVFHSLSPQPSLDPSINLETANFSDDLTLLDPNVQKTGDIITLKYSEKSWINQPLATRVENVNPFNVIEFNGNIELSPRTDSWTRTINIDVLPTPPAPAPEPEPEPAFPLFGGFFGNRANNNAPAPAPEPAFPLFGGFFRNRGNNNAPAPAPAVVRAGLLAGVGFFNNAPWGANLVGNLVATRTILTTTTDTHIRSRNVMFKAIGLRPLARHYHFFDSTSGLDIVPKLVEISMTSGVFQVGETVRGYVGGTNLFTCRVVRPNHKTGPGSNPTSVFTLNPYNKSITLPTSYSSSSTVLNIDVEALQEEVLGKFSGYITTGMVLLGETSGAQASVTNIRLVADTFGDIYGSMFFRDPLSSPPPPLRFTTGTKTFKLTSSSTNEVQLQGSTLISSAETNYNTTGTVNTFETIFEVQRRDPLAQSFTVDETGAFITGVDVFFANKDENEKIFIELRTVELGIPTNNLVTEYSRVTLDPSEIITSTDASVATNIKFPSPVYLESNTEYAVVLLSPYSDLYEVWIARMGEKTVNTSTLPDAESVIATKQYIGGSLFKSQNGTVWTANQFEDLKFKLYKAEFTTNPGTAYFYNPSLGTRDTNLGILNENPIKTLPRKLKVGITTTTTMDSILKIGKKVSDSTSASAISGYIEKIGGQLDTTFTNRVGAGYSDGTFTDVSFYSITGNGSGATGTVTFSSGVVSGNPTITLAGNGYVVGDILGITTSNVVKGKNAQISVSSLSGTDTLFLTNVQGEAFTEGQDLVVYSDTNTAVAYANTDIRSSDIISNLYDGRVIEVTHPNHGMHADNNVVILADLAPDTIPTTLNADLGISDATISVANTSLFATFEGISTSRGYLKVNNEIIYYNSITAGSGGAGTLGIGTRGIDGSLTRSHSISDKVYPYELNGISLTRINTQHNLPSDTTLKNNRDFDTYHLQISRGSRTSGDNQLSFTDENTVGGSGASATKNIQFNRVDPQFSVLTPGDTTSISAQVRTVSATSAGGSEVSFTDQGYENVELNNVNELNTSRMVASEINETTRLTSLPKNKSFTLALSMSSGDPNLSPAINVPTASVVFGRNRLNNPVSDYAYDGRVNLVQEDPHTAVYATSIVRLQQPATSLKVLISSYRHSSADFRVLYQLFRVDSNGVEQAYELFPGYDNLTDTNGDGYGDKVIDSTLNNGRSDAFVRSSNDGEFLEYQFSADELEQFNAFRIKIVMSGTNEARSPRFKDLRTIALA